MKNKAHISSDPEVNKLGDLIKDIRIAMLTTITPEDKLHSTPLMTQEIDFDGDLWFLISKNSTKIQDLKKNEDISVSYAGSGKYISITGTAELLEDREKVQEVWHKAYEAWFPQGPLDPSIQLLKVNVDKAEYWEGHSSPVYRMIEFVKIATGKPANMGTHGTLDLKH